MERDKLEHSGLGTWSTGGSPAVVHWCSHAHYVSRDRHQHHLSLERFYELILAECNN